MSSIAITRARIMKMDAESLKQLCVSHDIPFDENKANVRGKLGYLRKLITEKVGGFKSGRPHGVRDASAPKKKRAKTQSLDTPITDSGKDTVSVQDQPKNKEEVLNSLAKDEITKHVASTKSLLEALSVLDPGFQYIFDSSLRAQFEFLLEFVDRMYLHPKFIAWQQIQQPVSKPPLELSLRRVMESSDPECTKEFWKQTMRGGKVQKAIIRKCSQSVKQEREWLSPILQVIHG